MTSASAGSRRRISSRRAPAAIALRTTNVPAAPMFATSSRERSSARAFGRKTFRPPTFTPRTKTACAIGVLLLRGGPPGREPSNHARTRQFPERVLPHPPRRGVRGSREAAGERDRGRVEVRVAPSDPAQGPGHGLLHEVPLVGRRPLDKRQAPEERGVLGTLVVERDAREEREPGALLELGAAPRPLLDLPEGVGRAVEQVEAGRVDDRPTVEVPAPAVHLLGRDEGRVVDERREEARLVPPGLPERLGELVAAPELPCQDVDLAHRDAERLRRGDAVARHPLPGCPSALPLQPDESLSELAPRRPPALGGRKRERLRSRPLGCGRRSLLDRRRHRSRFEPALSRFLRASDADSPVPRPVAGTTRRFPPLVTRSAPRSDRRTVRSPPTAPVDEAEREGRILAGLRYVEPVDIGGELARREPEDRVPLRDFVHGEPEVLSVQRILDLRQ